MSGIVLPKEYAFPVASVVGALWLTSWQGIKVGAARSAAGIPYPQPYAEKADAVARTEAQVFNCTQRAHQNTLENLPAVIVSTLVFGTKYPVAAASICGAWVLFRIVYTIGYSTGKASKRNMFGSNPAQLLSAYSLTLGATYTAAKLVMDALQ